jgi:secondary thiamine-phosphate synthase enzyme
MIMAVDTKTLRLSTRGNTEIQDITGGIETLIRQSDIANGIVTVFCPSATSGLTTIEFESGCVSDLQRLFDEIIEPDRYYSHNEKWGDGNGHSHVRAAVVGPSLTIPIVNRRLTLGTWQQIIYMDFDIRERNRELVVQIMGD